MPPTYVPLIRNGAGVDALFHDVTVTGGMTVADAVTITDNLTVTGYTELASGQSNGQFTLWSGAADTLRLGTAGGGVAVAEGTGATSGVATLAAGTVTVPTNKVTANSRIQLTVQSLGTVTAPQPVAVTARTAGTSFTIRSADATDTSTVAWLIITPA